MQRVLFTTVGIGIILLTSLARAAGDYTRLIPTDNLPPPVAPDLSVTAASQQLVYRMFAKIGPWYNQTAVNDQLKKNFDAALTTGWTKSTSLGQTGVLLKVQVLTEQVPGREVFYSLRGAGATLVGVGPDADAVCYAEKCYIKIDAPLRPGQALTADSGYVWVSKQGGIFQTRTYNMELLERRARQVRTDDQAAKAYAATIRAKGINGYAEQLARAVRGKEDEKAVTDLLKNRDDSIKRASDIDAQLAIKLREAERARETSATLDAIAGAFSLESAIAMASASIGEDIQKEVPGGITTEAGLRAAVDEIEARTGKTVKSISAEQQSLRDNISGWEIQIQKIGVKYQMTPDAGTSMTPLP